MTINKIEYKQARKYLLLYSYISLLIFIISCFLPCFSVRDSPSDYMGYTAFLFGWIGVFTNSELTIHYISWYANILFMLSFFIKNRLIRIILSLGSLILSCLFYGCPYIVINEAGKQSNITTLKIGYYMWVISFLFLLLGKIITITKSIPQRQNRKESNV